MLRVKIRFYRQVQTKDMAKSKKIQGKLDKIKNIYIWPYVFFDQYCPSSVYKRKTGHQGMP